jgi:Multicopper oxidase
MKMLFKILKITGFLAVLVSTGSLMLTPGSAMARAWIDGISGTSFNFTAGAGELSIADGGTIHFWGYEDLGNNEGVGLPQYPGPTLILTEDVPVTITLTSNLPFNQCTSIIFPGHNVTATGGIPGILTRESCDSQQVVTYTFTPTEPGTYTYYSGTQMELQVEMGLLGTILVRPAMGTTYAYDHADTYFDHEYLFFLTSMDPVIHQLVEQGRFNEVDLTARWPVYWFINGRTAPDDLSPAFVKYLPHQPYNITPRMSPGQKLLVRLIGGDQDQHPLHLHGNHYWEIARDGRMLASNGNTSGPDLQRGRFTTDSVPGQTVDAIFQWTGEKLGWDIYGTPTDGAAAHDCIDSDGDGFGDSAAGSTYEHEYCADHGKPLPVALPQNQDLNFGGWWSGSPFMGNLGELPPGEGGLNPFGGFFFMWHSHAEKELTNDDIFPGGMLSMMVVEPPGTPIP